MAALKSIISTMHLALKSNRLNIENFNIKRTAIGTIERLTNNRNVIYKLNDTYFAVRIEDINEVESIVQSVYLIFN